MVVSYFDYLNKKIKNKANSENPCETAYKEPYRLDFHCLQMYVRIYMMSEFTRLYPTIILNTICTCTSKKDY